MKIEKYLGMYEWASYKVNYPCYSPKPSFVESVVVVVTVAFSEMGLGLRSPENKLFFLKI